MTCGSQKGVDGANQSRAYNGRLQARRVEVAKARSGPVANLLNSLQRRTLSRITFVGDKEEEALGRIGAYDALERKKACPRSSEIPMTLQRHQELLNQVKLK